MKLTTVIATLLLTNFSLANAEMSSRPILTKLMSCNVKIHSRLSPEGIQHYRVSEWAKSESVEDKRKAFMKACMRSFKLCHNSFSNTLHNQMKIRPNSDFTFVTGCSIDQETDDFKELYID